MNIKINKENPIYKILHTWLNNNGDTDYHISDIPNPLWVHIRRQFITTPFIIIAGIVSSIILKDFIAILLALGIALLVLYHGLTLIKAWYSNEIEVIPAVMYEEFESEKVFGLFHSRRYLLLVCQNQTYLKVFTPESFTPELGNEIEIYAYKDAFRQLNEDTVLASNYLVIKITKQRSDMEIADELFKSIDTTIIDDDDDDDEAI